jgi:hypothetical protein
MDQDYNQRQYWLMLESLSNYEAGKIGIRSLSNAIDGLVHALENIPDNLRHSMLAEWATLDTIIALMMDEGVQDLSPQRARVATDAVTKLKFLVLNEIDDPADNKRTS